MPHKVRCASKDHMKLLQIALLVFDQVFNKYFTT